MCSGSLTKHSSPNMTHCQFAVIVSVGLRATVACLFITHAHSRTHSRTAPTKPKQRPERSLSALLARHVSVTFKPVNSFEGLGLAADVKAGSLGYTWEETEVRVSDLSSSH